MLNIMRWSVISLCLIVVMGTTALCADAPPADSETMIYSRPMGYKGIGLDNWTDLGTFLRVDGKLRRISFIQGPHVAARLAPDGKAFLFHSTEGGKLGVWLSDLGGSTPRRLGDGSAAEWSSDGKHILFVRDGKAVDYDVTTGSDRIVSPEKLSTCRFASYGPGGSMLIVNAEAGKDVLYVVAEGAAPRVLATGDIDSTPKCSPDGARVGYQNGAHIFVIPFAGGTPKQLTRCGGVQAWPKWSRDGKTIYYSQRSEPLATLAEIDALDVEASDAVSFVMRDVNPSFDWNGVVAGGAEKKPIPGSTLAVYHCDGKIGISGSGLYKANPTPLAVDAQAVPMDGTVAVENDWFLLDASKEASAVTLSPKRKYGFGPAIAISVRGGGKQTVASRQVLSRDADEVRVAFSFTDQAAGRIEFVVKRASPSVVIAPSEAGSVSLALAAADAVIAPDRYANDIVIESKELPASPGTMLPGTPFVVICTERGGGIAVTARDPMGATLRASKAAESAGVDLTAPAGAKLTLAVMGDDFWSRPKIKTSDKGWGVDWKPAINAQWRLAGTSGGMPYARMWSPAEALSVAGAAPETCIAYLWGRVGKTSLDMRTCDDVLNDAFGTREAAARLDTVGIRGWRSSRDPVAMQEIFMHPHGWDPSLVHTAPGDLGILEAMMGITRKDTEPSKSVVRHYGEDVIRLLTGLDDRVAEYKKFLADMGKLCASDDVRGDAFLTNVAEQLKAVTSGPAGKAGGTGDGIDDVKTSLDALVNTAFDGRSHIYGAKQYKEFSALTRAALEERLAVIDAARRFAQRIRDDAGLYIVAHPDAPASCEKVRAMARDILRDRYYLERDWRGEVPMTGGVQ